MYVLVVLLLLFVDKLGVWAVWLLADEPHTSGKIWQENAQHVRFVVSTMLSLNLYLNSESDILCVCRYIQRR